MKAIIFDIDGTLLESIAVDTELYFSAVREVLGPVRIRELSDYEHVTDSGILAQLLADNGYAQDPSAADAIKSIFIEGVRTHIEQGGSFPAIEGAVQFFERVRNAGHVRAAIATGGWRESALLKLNSAGFNIDGVPLATSNDAHSRVEIMRSALRQAGDGFASVTYFGDAAWDQRACRELGWELVAVGPDLGGIESYVDVAV